MATSTLTSALFLATFLAASSSITALTFDPYVPGPHTPITIKYPMNETDLPKNVQVWAPQSGGPHSVILLSGSYASNIPGDLSMSSTIEHLVSWGFVVINPYKIDANPADNYHTNYIDPVLDYLREYLRNDLIQAGADPSTSFDLDNNMITLGHSSGNHVNVNYLREKCGPFVAQVLLSPVDGADPLGIIQDFCITPGKLVNYNMPTLVMQAGLDPVKGNPLFPACAPAKLSNRRFYDAMPGDRWFLNASDYGHADFFEDDFVGAVEFLSFCATNKEAEKSSYRQYVGGSIVAFAKAVLEPDMHCDMLKYVEDVQMLPVPNNGEFDAPNKCSAPAQCIWSPEEEEAHV